ncbi:MAG: sulfurtransferase TusA family protein [Candidatus Thorarchaeota archaeon]
MEFDEEIDVRGRVCPYPSLTAMKMLEKMVAGTVLKIRVNSKKSVETVQRQLAKQKGELLDVEEGDEEWTLYYKRIN